MAKTQTAPEPGTNLVPLEQEVGSRVLAAIENAPHVSVAGGTDATEAVLAIVARILDASTTAEMNAVFGGNTTNSRDLAKSGTKVELRSMTLRPSDFPDEATGVRGWYGQFDAVNLETGEAILISTSSKAAIVAFTNADARGLTPVQGEFAYGNETEAGFVPVHFEFADSSPSTSSSRRRRV